MALGSVKLPDLAGLNTIQKGREQKMSIDAKRLAERIVHAAMATVCIVLSAMPSAEAQTPFYRASEQEIAAPSDCTSNS
jgi:hypothetical protein